MDNTMSRMVFLVATYCWKWEVRLSNRSIKVQLLGMQPAIGSKYIAVDPVERTGNEEQAKDGSTKSVRT